MFKIVRTLSLTKVRTLCVENDLYTCGCNEEYDEMFQKCRKVKTDADIYDVALDIVQHSCYGPVEDMGGLEQLLWELATNCTLVMIQEG